MSKQPDKDEQQKPHPISHQDAESGSPDESIAGEEDPGAALEDIVKERENNERWKKNKKG